MTTDLKLFDEANQKVHSCFAQWHYPIMTAAGFECLTMNALGFVRSYRYRRGGVVIRCCTGANAEYFVDESTQHTDYWSHLEDYVNDSISNI